MPFLQLVKEIAQKQSSPGLCFQKGALMVLKEATEAYLIQFLQDKHSIVEIDSATKEEILELVTGRYRVWQNHLLSSNWDTQN